MKDVYPRLDTLPHEWLTVPEDQPEYLDVPGVRLDEGTDLGSMLCDVPARNGLGGTAAIVHHESGRSLTFSELSAVTDRAAAALAGLGIGPGDRVALRGGNGPELIIAAIATWKIGAVVTLIPPLARAGEVEFFLADTRPRLLVLTQPESEEIGTVLKQVPGLTVISMTGGQPGALAWDAMVDAAGPRFPPTWTAWPSSGIREVRRAGPRAGTTPSAVSCWAACRSGWPPGRRLGSGGRPRRRWATRSASSTALTSPCSTASPWSS